MDNIKEAVLRENNTINHAIESLDKTGIKIIFLVNEVYKLIATITDGDIRRGLIRGCSLNCSLDKIANYNPIALQAGIPNEVVLSLMREKKIQQIPIIDSDKKIIGVYLWEKLLEKENRKNPFIIMAGGQGSRLMPFTEACPKPMLKVNNRPILESIILRAKAQGFVNFVISLHHLPDMIKNYFGNGNNLGVSIEYIYEQKPLGTAGCLSLLRERINQDFIVTNGDLLSGVNYGSLLDYHIERRATATMCVRTHEYNNPYGVVELNGEEIIDFQEKPIISSKINAGVYALSENVLKTLETNEYCDMPNLFLKVKGSFGKIMAYELYESWADIGTPEDFNRANAMVNNKPL